MSRLSDAELERLRDIAVTDAPADSEPAEPIGPLAPTAGSIQEMREQATGRDPHDATRDDRFLTAAANSERVAALHGSGYWTGPRSMR